MAKAKKKKTVAKKSKAKRAVKAVKKKKVQAIPSHYSNVIPGFRVQNCAGAVAFLQKVFGAKVRDRYDGPNGALMHAELQIGNVTLMCGDGQGPNDTQTLAASIYVKNVDDVFAKAVAEGAQVKQPVTLQFYGDRSGRVTDAWGNEWSIATHVEDVSRKEMMKRMAALPQQQAA
jgi:PhnB protein